MKEKDEHNFDPFAKDTREDFPLLEFEEQSTITVGDTVELFGLRKRCTECEIYMDTAQATEAEIYANPELNDTDIKTWAVCPQCKKIILIA